VGSFIGNYYCCFDCHSYIVCIFIYKISQDDR
jgi:hypothetical protein